MSVSLLLILFFSSRFSHAQDSEYDSLLEVYLKLDSVWLAEIERDSLSIFSLIDSIVSNQPKSQIALRTSYNSKVFNIGRDYGIDQYSITNGVSYYHKSGLYADLSGYYYSGISPHYNATAITLGYSSFISPKWGYNLNVSRTFFDQLDESASFNNTLNYNLGVSTFYYSKYLTVGLDYIYSFGSEEVNAHRIVPSLTFTPHLKTKGFLKRIKFNPILYATYGTETLYSEQYNNIIVRNLIKKIGHRNFMRAYRRGNDELFNLIYDIKVSDYFGLLNVQMTFPIQYHHKKFTGTLSYNVNVPVTIPGEELDSQVNGYFGISLYYLFNHR